MLPEKLNCPVVYSNGHAHFLERVSGFSLSYFGGPSEREIFGLRHGPHRIHHILTLNWQTIPGLDEPGVFEIPLFYGLRFDGCSMAYDFSETSRCRLLELEPRKSSAEWPYSGYPDLLPYFSLGVARRVECSIEQFRKLLAQRDELFSDEVVVIVPPLFDIGVSLWGRSGDSEGVQIVFRCDIKKQIVRVYNECT